MDEQPSEPDDRQHRGQAMGVEAMGVPGMRVSTGEIVPSSAAWAIEVHESGNECGEERALRQLARSHEAPPCPRCGEPVTWRLEVAAPSAAAIETTSERTTTGGADRTG